MRSPSRQPRQRVLFLSLAVALALACEREQPSVEELYTTRTLGLGYLQRNQLVEAESAFRRLTRLAPDDPLGYTNLGLTYLQAGRLEDAEKQLLRARKLDPRSVETGLALARLYAVSGRAAEGRTVLEELRRDAAANAHVLYALAELELQGRDSASQRRYADRLRDVLVVAPASVVARLDLARALAAQREADSALRHLEEVRRIPPAPPREARALLDSTMQLLRAGVLADARERLARFVELMEGTVPYQASLEEVKWAEGPIPGRAILTFAPQTFVSLTGVRERATVGVATFVDATLDAGLPAVDSAPGPAVAPMGGASAIAAGDVNGDRVDDLFVSAPSAPRGGPSVLLYRVQGGFVHDDTERSGLPSFAAATHATFADYDNDGWLDLFAIGLDGRAHLFRNKGDRSFADVTARTTIGDVKGASRSVFVDLDHDGDLDLVLLGETTRTVYRNNLDGTFTETTAEFGLQGDTGTHDAVFADFDGDGRIDLFLANGEARDVLFANGGAERFRDVSVASGIATGGAPGSSSVAAGDYDNDGDPDLFVTAAEGGDATLWRNRGDGTFTRDARSSQAMRGLRGLNALAATFVDHDNDGWLDLVVAGRPPARGTAAVYLFRNDGSGVFVDRSAALPAPVRVAGARAIEVSDVDDDGDQDLWLLDGAGRARLLRNELGNSNLAVRVELRALGAGSGKNNAFGVGARLELRAGQVYQTRVATDRVTHFGLGPHLKADVLRVEWPNGVPQTVYLPGTDQDVVEQEMLKGSCAFVYTWDGSAFRFVTDAMWRSALGMPLGLMGSGSAFAPAGASQEYVRIPGEALRPRNGRYVLQFTEELWETAYADEVKLLAVDHPDSVDVFVDERFVPPGPVALRLYHVAKRELPRSAVDERGTDVLPALRQPDDVFVSNLTPTRYQGVVEPHDLVLDLGPGADGAGSHLFLRGWIYPTDASINVALGQQSDIAVRSPSLEVRGADGRWRRAIANIGFPSGKDKTLVIDLSGIFPTADRHVRIRTSMQIYWDHAFTSRVLTNGEATVTTLSPVAADLHERGFSRMYRKGGRHGPYWFAYDDVTKESPWRPITGAFTRFGDVLPLLRQADDMYVVMAPGDEATIEFDASSATSLRPGWTRDFLLYTDGWIKDSDLNTAFGTTVEPLPFHDAQSYPYRPGEGYPTDSVRARYRHEYNTRVVRAPGSRSR